MKDTIKKVLEFSKSQQWNELEDFLIKKDSIILNIVQRSLFKYEGFSLLDSVLKALTCKSRESADLKVKIYVDLIPLIKSDESSDERENGKIVTILIVHFDNIPIGRYAEVATLFFNHLKQGLPFYGRWTDLFGHILSCASQKNEISSLKSGNERCSSEALRQEALRVIFECKWDPQTAASLLVIFKEINLSAIEKQETLEKVQDVLKSVEALSVPPIVYNLLRLWLSFDSFTSVLTLLMKYFNDKEKDMEAISDSETLDSVSNADFGDRSADLIEARATVILHVTEIAQFHWQIIKDYIKLIKFTWLPEQVFTSFNLALALSFTRNPRFKDPIVETLKSSVLKHFRAEEKKRSSLWFSNFCGSQLNIRKVFQSTVQNCKGGWDQVNDGMVSLCFSLLESGGGLKKETYPSQQCVALACAILPLIFKMEPRLAPEILKMLSTQLLAASCASQYIDLIGRLVKSCPLLLLDLLPMVRELLEVLSFLPENDAEALLLALLPIIKNNGPLKDDIIIILRKMLFSKVVENRLTAVRGFCELLRNLRLTGCLPSSQASMSFSSSMSQVSAEIHATRGGQMNSNASEALCLEVLGILRRVLMQQADVRSVLYRGLYEVSKSNPKLIPSILELLLQHTRMFVDLKSSLLNPILHKKVINSQGDAHVLIEPLPELFSCLTRIVFLLRAEKENAELWSDEEIDVSDLMTQSDAMFDALIEKLAYSDVEDLNLTELGSSKHTLMLGDVFSGILDALMEHVVRDKQMEFDVQIKATIALFKTRKRLLTYVKDKTSAKKESGKAKDKSMGSRNSEKQTAQHKNTLSFDVSVELLRLSLISSSSEIDGNSIQGNFDIQEFALLSIEQNISHLKTLSQIYKNKYLNDMKTAAKLIFEECVSQIKEDRIEVEPREIEIFRLHFSTIHSLFKVFVKYFNEKLQQILRDILGKSPSSRFESMLLSVFQQFLGIFVNIVKNENYSKLLGKDSNHVLQIIAIVTSEMENNSKELLKVQETLEETCAAESLQNNSNTAEELVKLLLTVSERNKPNNTLPRSISREIHYQLGDIEESVTLEGEENYKVISGSTAAYVLSSYCNHCNDVLSTIEMALCRLSAMLGCSYKFDENEVDKMICLKLVIIIQSLEEVLQSALPNVSSQDSVVKIMTKFYNNITQYVKYYSDYFRIKNNPQISQRFEKLIHCCGNMLKENSYKMITYINNKQLENPNRHHSLVAAQAMKEARLIPNLVFAIEHYEKHLIILSKKAKVDLFAGTKITTSRDFRIKVDALRSAIKRSAEEDEDCDESRGSREDEEAEANQSDAAEEENEPRATGTPSRGKPPQKLLKRTTPMKVS